MDSLTILDMEDYLQALPVKESSSWREGGVQYGNQSQNDEIRLADALGSASGLPVRQSVSAHWCS